jgi:hypothetical protein
MYLLEYQSFKIMEVIIMENNAVSKEGNRDIREAIMTLELLVYSWGLPKRFSKRYYVLPYEDITNMIYPDRIFH